MRFTKVCICNYRQYQSLEFDFPESDHDLHIIIAQNGVGKTNLLNALTWCLYGTEPHLGNANNESAGLPRYNITALNEARAQGKTSFVIQVDIYATDNGEKVIFTGRQPVTITGGKPFLGKEEHSVRVSAGHDYETLPAEEAKLYTEKYMPESIREYVFFDGEQLNNYFQGDTSKRIREAVYSISQVDIVSRIAKRLDDVVTDYQREATNKEPSLQDKYDRIMAAKQAERDAETDCAKLREQIALSEAEVTSIGEQLRDTDNLPELEAEYADIKATREAQETKRQAHIQKMIAFVREKKVVLAYYPVAREAIRIIDAKRASKVLPPDIDKKLLETMLEAKHCSICDHDLDAHAIRRIQGLLSQIQVSSETSNLLNSIYDELSRVISEAKAYPQEKKAYMADLQDMEADIKKSDKRLQELAIRIDKVTDPEKAHVRKLFHDREMHEELLKKNRKSLGAAEYRYEQAVTYREKCEREYREAMGKSKEVKRLREIIKYAQRGGSLLRSIEGEIMGDIRKQLETRTTEQFLSLIWKKNTYSHITLSDDYQLNLFSLDGYSCVATCSAAERCLLALAFTLALHEVSGFDSILFIDTPVARVSDTNRANFADVLSDVSSRKQIIMTFAPDEYSSEIRQVFEPLLASSRRLVLENEAVVRIGKEAF